ncbi:16115_t:CDS:2 [Funneliformis geosporum]|uniref:13064_t:CDS:1 n=1 Tax=Funneliformis geosporum TaxID=1117311 RepID=A0A9W4SND7_9GLOM|nr:13064_t:CDS:2 [Funneliformis geosporum]CAI2176774.1 16115_t:CDS:2 [Funneliformis geosporum]
MSLKRNVSTQTLPNHTVERTSTLCISPNCLRKVSDTTRKPTFSMLKITCVQNIDYNLQLLPTLCHLSEEDMQKMDIVLFQQHIINRIDGKLSTLNTKKENIILKRLCRLEIWRQFGFSHIEPEPLTKPRQFNKTLLRQKLMMAKQELLSLEIAAIDMAFLSLIKNLLLERYPLIFSFNFQEKLQSTTKYIPTISKSITRIIKNSPNVEFRSQAIELIKKTRKHVNLSFSLYRDIKEGPDLTSIQTKNILGNGLYTIARDTNVPAPLVIEHVSSDEEISDNRIMSRDIIKSGKPDLNYNSKDICDVSEVDFEMILNEEDGKLLFDTDEGLFIGEKTFDVEDESMFENECDNNQNLVEEEFEYSSSSENYEDFWDEEEIQFLFGTSNSANAISMDLTNDYKIESSKKEISHETFNIVDDVDLLDFGTFDEVMHDEYLNLDNSEGSSSLIKRYVSNNLFPHSRPRSPFRDKTITLLQGQETRDFKKNLQKSMLFQQVPIEKNQGLEDTFFDQMFDGWS